jgi:hypothetical protein
MKTQAIWLTSMLALAAAQGAPAQTESNPPVPTVTRTVILTTNTPAPVTKLSPWANDIAKLARAGVANDVVFSFIDNAGTFNLDADQIIRLHQLDVPTPWIIAMIQHDADVVSGARPLTITSSPSTPATIQIVLAKANSNADKKPVTTPVPANTVAVADVNNDSAEQIEADARAEDEAQAALLKMAREAQEKGNLYRVRQPYAEQVTPPILVFKSASLTPNTLLIEFSQ